MSDNICHKHDAAVSSLPLYSIPLIPSLVKFSASDFVQSLSYSPSINDFKCLLEDSNGVELFKRFLDKERAAHYLEFWFACQGFKTAENDKVYQLIKVIYRAYVRSESQYAVALKPNTKKNIVDKISNKQFLDKTIFDKAQLEIRDILISDFYQRFIKSESFKLYQQSSLHSDHSKSSGNTESLKEHEPSYVECCDINTSQQSQKCKKDKPELFCKAGRGKTAGCGNTNTKDRRSLAESDPILFVQQVSSKLEKFHLMQHYNRNTSAEHRRQADISEVLEDDAESILDNHCSYLMAKDSYKIDPAVTTQSKHDTDIRSVLSHDSGVATTFDPNWNSRITPSATYFPQTYLNSGNYQATPQYKHHHIHDHHHFKTRRRNRSEDQSVCSLEERSSNQVPSIVRKGKSQASDASSIFDSGVSSTYEQLSHPWIVANDRVSNWVNTNPGIMNTPVELTGYMKKNSSAQPSGYKHVINEVGEPPSQKGEVWIDSCCIETLPEKPKVKCAVPKNKSNSQSGSESNIVIGYYFCGDPVPYRTQVTCVEGHFTLGKFKQLLPKRGPYRYFFKRPCDEFEGNGAVQEEYTRDDDILPLWEGKIVAKVEKAEHL